jgi:hypothetical protein
VSKLLVFDFHVEFKPGMTNVVADMLLRRNTEEMAAMVLSYPSFQLFDALRLELESTPELCALREKAAMCAKGEGWHMQDGLIIVKGRIYLSATSPYIQQALTTAHGTGLEGIAKTLHRLHADFHVPGSCAIITEFVRACTTCQRNKAEYLHPAGLLQPLEVLGLGRRRNGLRRGVPTPPQQIGGAHGGRPILQVHALHRAWPPLHGDIRSTGILQHHSLTSRCAQLHRQR